MIAYQIVVVLHIAFAALLFAGPLGLSSLVKAAAAAGPQALGVASETALRRTGYTFVGALGVLGSGVAMIFLSAWGGFKGLPPRFHIALTLGLVMVVVSAVLLHPAAKLIANDPAKAVKRLAMSGGIIQLLWVVCLVLMYLV